MKENRRFKIDIYGLKNGVHEYDFKIDETLFENFEGSIVDKGSGNCHITLLKKETMIELGFSIEGTLRLICDRSNESFDYPLSFQESLLIKYGDEYDTSNEDLWVIPSTQQSINIQHPLYEFITLSVPMKKLHPKFETTEEEEEKEIEWVYSSEEEEPEQKEESKEDDIDPRWAALKSIKRN